MPLIQERLNHCGRVELTDFIFQDELTVDAGLLVGKKMTAAESLHALRQVQQTLKGVRTFDPETLEPPLRELTAALNLKAGQLFGILRVAVTGKQVAPPLFETMEVLGRETCLERIDRAIDALAGLESAS